MFSHSTALQGATPAAQAGGAAGQARRRAILASAARSEGSPALPRRELLLASLCTAAAAATGCLPPTAAAAVPPAQELSGAALAPAAEAAATGGVGDVTPIYFGNGCFWGRQYDYVSTEKALGRGAGSISARVGYAGGAERSPDGRVCYYYADELTVYERLGHAEVVQVEVHGSGAAAQQQFRAFARTYFTQFTRTPFGMLRLDPQDAGPGYRNVIGLPGGVRSPFMRVLEEENIHGMRLVEGRGNAYRAGGRASEGDDFNTVWIVDSATLPFYQAEVYHQFHNGIGERFPAEYTQGLKETALRAGRINPTGCPEYSFGSSSQ